MSKRIGYSPNRADRIKNGLMSDMTRIETIARRMTERVTDHGPNLNVDRELLAMREVVHHLMVMVDRRTDGEPHHPTRNLDGPPS